MSIFVREQLYRSSPVMAKLKNHAVTVCGAGALGANIIESLARSGFNNLKVIDRDRIEERNLSTQPYYRSDVGAFKAKILANNLYRAIGVKVEAQTQELTAKNIESLVKGSDLVIDAFDNSTSRGTVKAYCDRVNLPCLHAGLGGDYAEVIWNDVYRVPSDTNDDVCDYPLARNLVMLTVAIACESIITFVATEKQLSYTVTLKDLTIQTFV
jgi:molybdopterin/thiamine biosynthesis adenylyltransferase